MGIALLLVFGCGRIDYHTTACEPNADEVGRAQRVDECKTLPPFGPSPLPSNTRKAR